MSAFKAKSVRPAPANYFRVRADDNNQTQSAVDEEIGLINDFNSKFQYNPPYIDKYVEQLYATINDPDCMEGEVDFASDDFRVENAIRIWQKCRLLVLRNIIDKAYIYEFRKNVTQFVYDLNEGKVNDKGRTSYADPYYVYDVSSHRWDLLLPSRFVSEQIITDGRLMQILSDERVLGEQMKLMAFGMVMSEPNAECQQWHNDADYVYGDGNSLRCLGAAGIEYPSSQITLMAPLLNITHQHGPTQFCMGSAALNGFDSLDEVDQWFDHALKERFFTNEMAINEFSDFLDGWCPQKMWRSTHINMGDMLLWDFSLTHRAGRNNSTDFRTALYASFSRSRIQDQNFHNESVINNESKFLEKVGELGRFGSPKEAFDEKCARPWSQNDDFKRLLGNMSDA